MHEIKKIDSPLFKQVRENILKAVKIFKTINFKCDFKEGVCASYRCGKGSYIDSEFMKGGCCCSNCAEMSGYHNYVTSEMFDEYEKYWNDNTGFYDIKTGCKLPPELRSEACLAYACDLILKGMSKKDINKISKIRSLFKGLY